MRKLSILLALAMMESWPASIMVGANRPYKTILTAIQSRLPLQDDLHIYVEMPTGNYAPVTERIVPDASWNGRRVTVDGIKFAPEITGYIDDDVVFEWTGDEVLPSAYNIRGPGGTVDGNISPTGDERYYFKDHLGSTRMTIDDHSQIREASQYSAYGKEYWVLQPAADGTKEKFTGKEFDNEGAYGADPGVNLFFFGARYYDPDIGMWISTDPAGQYPSPYSYCGGNPIGCVDKNGKYGIAAGFVDGKLVSTNPNVGDAIRNFQTAHYERNTYNHAPSSFADASKLNWTLLPASKSVFHMQGPGGDFNKKFVDPTGHHEGVYDINGGLVTDPVNMGTYNFFGPQGSTALLHVAADVVPYYLWGNTPNDPTTFLGRLGTTFDAPSQFTEGNVYLNESEISIGK